MFSFDPHVYSIDLDSIALCIHLGGSGCGACVKKLSTSIWPAPYDSTVHFVCTTFEVHPGGARQPADEAFYLIAGNLHVPSSRSVRTSRRIVNACLHCLSCTGTEHAYKPVARKLVGACNLNAEQARATSQPTNLPCSGTALQRQHPLNQWEVVTTTAPKSDDVIFIQGVLVKFLDVTTPCTVNPLLKSVSLRISVPFAHSLSGAPQPATCVLSAQPCRRRKASHASESSPEGRQRTQTSSESHEQSPHKKRRRRRRHPSEALAETRHLRPTPPSHPPPADAFQFAAAQRRQPSQAPSQMRQRRPTPPPHPPPGGAFQPAVRGSPLINEVDLVSSECSADYDYKSPTREVRDVDNVVDQRDVASLHQQMYQADEDQVLSPKVLTQLNNVLFRKKTYMIDGVKRHAVASIEETLQVLRALLQRRQAFMRAHNIKEGRHYVFTNPQRQLIMKEWKDEYHSTPKQLQLQLRDSWEPRAGASQLVK